MNDEAFRDKHHSKFCILNSAFIIRRNYGYID
jgi:hypothetical protein